MISLSSPAILYAAAALALGTVLQCQAASEAEFVDALKTFQQARNGEDRQIEPAIAAFDALARAEPQQPAYAAYLGSALTLKAREAWMPWNNPGPNVGELIDSFAAVNDVRIENL